MDKNIQNPNKHPKSIKTFKLKLEKTKIQINIQKTKNFFRHQTLIYIYT